MPPAPALRAERSYCGAICPAFGRGCYGCFGPMETPNTAALSARWRELGVSRPDVTRAFRTFNANSGPFRKEAETNEGP